jgi:hypothetical protein
MDWYTFWADRLKPEYELREVVPAAPEVFQIPPLLLMM